MKEEVLMKKALIQAVILGTVGLVIGYFIFAQSGGSYIPVQDLLFSGRGNILEKLNDALRGIEEIRRNILLTGAAGAVIGLVIGFRRR
jgi:hypothetical protein